MIGVHLTACVYFHESDEGSQTEYFLKRVTDATISN